VRDPQEIDPFDVSDNGDPGHRADASGPGD
jgi:hypothetical protein